MPRGALDRARPSCAGLLGVLSIMIPFSRRRATLFDRISQKYRLADGIAALFGPAAGRSGAVLPAGRGGPAGAVHRCIPAAGVPGEGARQQGAAVYKTPARCYNGKKSEIGAAGGTGGCAA